MPHEVQALVRIRPAGEMVCSPLRPLFLATVWYARFYQAEPAPVVGNHPVPRVPLPDVGVTFIRKPCTGSSEGITPRSSLLRTHSPIPCGSPFLRLLASCKESWQVATSPCCPWDLPDDISANPSSDACSHTPAGPTECIYLFLPLCPRPSPSRDWVGFPLCSANTTFRRGIVEAADIPLCSGLRVCSPPRSFLPLCLSHRAAEAFTFGLSVLRYLRTHRIC
jgi:hypothetical protein